MICGLSSFMGLKPLRSVETSALDLVLQGDSDGPLDWIFKSVFGVTQYLEDGAVKGDAIFFYQTAPGFHVLIE